MRSHRQRAVRLQQLALESDETVAGALAADFPRRLQVLDDERPDLRVTGLDVDPGALEFKAPEKASGNTLRQTVVLRQGIDANLARQLVREIKDSKLKVQVSVQGSEVRVTGKKRDDLQAAIALVRALKIEQPLQYVNFRE